MICNFRSIILHDYYRNVPTKMNVKNVDHYCFFGSINNFNINPVNTTSPNTVAKLRSLVIFKRSRMISIRLTTTIKMFSSFLSLFDIFVKFTSNSTMLVNIRFVTTVYIFRSLAFFYSPWP